MTDRVHASVRVCAVVPYYNHPQRIEVVVAGLAAHNLPVIVVDDGSNVPSKEALQLIKQKYPDTVVITLGENQGKGAAVTAGIVEAAARKFSHALQIDADGQHDLADIPRFVEACHRDPQALILGSPQFDESAPFARRYGRKISLPFVWLETGSCAIADALCGYRIYPVAITKKLLEDVHIASRMAFDVEILVRLCWRGANVVNIPTRVHYFSDASSHYKYLRDNAAFVRLHIKLLLSRAFGFHRSDFHRSGERGRHWARIGERGTLAGFRFLAWLFRSLGDGLSRALLLPVTGYFYCTAPRARHASREYLCKVLSPSLVSSSLVFRHFLEFSNAIVDKVISWYGAIPLNRFRWFGRDAFRELVRGGKGAVLVSAHFGNVEVLRALSHSLPSVRINALMFTRNSKRFVKILEEANPDSHLRLIPVEDVTPEKLFEFREQVAQGEVIALLADRVVVGSPDRTLPVEFLGTTANFPEGPWVLAALLECPVYLVFAMRGDDGIYDVHFEHFSDGLSVPRANRAKAMRELIERYAKRLEYYCRRSPLQWFNFYDFWRQGSSQGSRF